MNYRECRIITLYEIFKLSNKEIDLRKIFLVLGGLKNYVYTMKNKSIDVFFPSGFTDISCHNVFEKYNIENKAVTISEFLDNYDHYKKEKENKVFVLPFSSDVLGLRDVKLVDLTMFGQSYLPIKDVSFEERKILLEGGEDNKDYWIDMDICKEIENRSFSLLDGLKVYIIDKTAVKSNNELTRYFEQDYLVLIAEVVNEFEICRVYEYEDDLTKISGIDAYDYIIQQFTYIKSYYQSSESKLTNENSKESCEKIQQTMRVVEKYLFMEIRYFRQFILAGTDAYYRNEFLDVLKYVNELYNLKIEANIMKWTKITQKWRGIGRKLEILFTRRSNDKEYFYYCIDYLINIFKEIKELECDAMDELKCKINDFNKGAVL